MLDGTDNGWSMFPNFTSSQKMSSPWSYPQVPAMTADVAYSWVMDYVGASLSHDAIDRRLINQVMAYSGNRHNLKGTGNPVLFPPRRSRAMLIVRLTVSSPHFGLSKVDLPN